MPNTIASVEKPGSVWRSTDDTLKYKMKLFLYLFLISHGMDIKKTPRANILLWNVIDDCCLSAMSPFDSWSDSRLSSPSHLRGTSIAKVIKPPGCVAWGWTGGVSSARTGHCGLPRLGKKVAGRHPLLWLHMSEASAENGRRDMKDRVSVVTDPAIFRFRWELRNKLWEWRFEV